MGLPHAVPEPIGIVNLRVVLQHNTRKQMASRAYRRRQSVSWEATAFMKQQTSAHEIRSSEERNLKICRNSSGGMLLNIPVSI